MEFIRELLKGLPTLSRDTNPTAAAVIGFIAGGVGLAIYFRSLRDLVVPMVVVVLAIVLGSSVAGAGVIGGAALAGAYGYLRAVDSNQRRAAAA